MHDLNALMMFARVVEAQSFSEASRRLGVPLSTVSRKVAELENQLGVRLLERSTRQLRLTDIGAEILRFAQQGAEVHDAVDAVVSNQLTEVSGTLRLSCPPNIADSLIAPLISGFQASYPAVNVQVVVTERYVDHIADGIDLAFRVGRLTDSNLIAKRILRYRCRLLASPAYLARYSAPATPDDLGKHRLLTFGLLQREASWQLTNRSTTKVVTFRPHITMNDYAGLASALKSGSGIGELPPIVSPQLHEDGSLVEVLPDWHLTPDDLSILHLGNRHISRPVRLFKEFSAQMAVALFPDLPV